VCYRSAANNSVVSLNACEQGLYVNNSRLGIPVSVRAQLIHRLVGSYGIAFIER
jgi:hypothetical protein